MTIDAATLSSSPNGATYVAVSIVTNVLPPYHHYVAIWRKGWRYAVEIRPPDFEISFVAEDVVYHRGAFHLLHAHGDHISVCTAARQTYFGITVAK